MEILSVENLTKYYGEGNTRVEALKGINLKVSQGEFVAIMGPSGSGKSTLMHMIGGVDSPSSGKIYIGGQEITALNEKALAIFRRRKIGFIFQQYNLVPVLTVEENMKLPLLLDHRKVDAQYLNELLVSLDLQARRNHLPSQLSGGQQQRVAIGRAMIARPDLILADEPTGNLDQQNTKEVLHLLKSSVKQYHQTLIMITHDAAIAETAERIIKIEDGLISL